MAKFRAYTLYMYSVHNQTVMAGEYLWRRAARDVRLVNLPEASGDRL